MWGDNRTVTPPVPASNTLLSNHGGDTLDALFGQLDDSSEYYQDQYDNVTESLNNLPHYTAMTWTPNPPSQVSSYKPSLHVYPPHELPSQMHLERNNNSFVPSMYDPNSPLALSTPTSSPCSTTMASPATVPSPISPQHSPPAIVPQDVKPIIELKKVKVEATDCDQWETYVDHDHTYYGLYNTKQMPISSSISLRSRLIAENLEFSPVDNAYILYSYNTKSPDPFYIVKDSRFVPIEGLYFYSFDSELVEINQARGSRIAKDSQPPGYCIVENGRGSFNKLLFKAATANNARSGDDYEYICTNMSPCLIVRGQNPKRFEMHNAIAIPASPTTPAANPFNAIPNAKTKVNLLPVKAEPKRQDKEKAKKRQRRDSDADEHIEQDQNWAKAPAVDTIYVKDGKVGINTSAPPEALSVNGNIVLTGSILKPSDQRIKTNIQPVNTAGQLDKIKQLKIYDYELIHGKKPGATGDKERGLLAQQLKEVLPNATRTLKDVTMADGEVMKELIVVEERALLYESIGATQELSDIVKQDQEKLLSIDKRLDSCSQDTATTQKTLSTAGKLMEYIIAEKNVKAHKNNANLCCVMMTHTNKGFYGSICGLNPAWTMFIMGIFLPVFWVLGSFYLFSPHVSRKIAGAAHLIVGAAEVVGYWTYLVAGQYAVGTFFVLAAFLRWNYRRKLRSKRISYKVETEKRPEYVLQLASSPAEENNNKQQYMSIPMECLPSIENAVEHVNAKHSKVIPKSILVAAKNKNAAFAEEEWERNALIRNDLPV